MGLDCGGQSVRVQNVEEKHNTPGALGLNIARVSTLFNDIVTVGCHGIVDYRCRDTHELNPCEMKVSCFRHVEWPELLPQRAPWNCSFFSVRIPVAADKRFHNRADYLGTYRIRGCQSQWRSWQLAGNSSWPHFSPSPFGNNSTILSSLLHFWKLDVSLPCFFVP
jgi:hypothetical protein